jgi:putative solute:sodium symporter small subunit
MKASRLAGEWVLVNHELPWIDLLDHRFVTFPSIPGDDLAVGRARSKKKPGRWRGEAMVAEQSENRRIHWEKTRSLTYLVLVIWAVFSIIVPWFAGPLDAITFLGFKLGYYFVVQGSLIVFVLLIVFQNWRQDVIDDEFGMGE